MTTTDGYRFTDKDGLKAGLVTEGFINPPERGIDANKLYDIIIIGAGYAGLVTSRELASKGYNVLMLEARDRIGGRTWTAELDGHYYDMGGTWSHWFQPYIYGELHRYSMVDQLVKKTIERNGHIYTTLRHDAGEVDLKPEDEAQMRRNTLLKFFDVDGQRGRTKLPTPHRSLGHLRSDPELDSMSVQDRLDQIDAQLTVTQKAYLRATLVNICGVGLQEKSFYDILRWWALAGYSPDGIEECAFSYKLKRGQSSLARAIFDDVSSYATFAYAFKKPISGVVNEAGLVVVNSATGDKYRCRKAVCTVPWQLLNDIRFVPELSLSKKTLIRNVSLGHIVKIHAEVKGTEWDGWTHLSSSSALTGGIQFMASTGATREGNSTFVSFSLREPSAPELQAEQRPHAALACFKSINKDLDVVKLIFHNWTTDPFAKGVWVSFRTGEMDAAIPVLREPVGNIVFAGSDIADGWRGFIDGAIESGIQTSMGLDRELRKRKATAHL